jgi:putative addiction module component (TIGR02574 family)
MSASLEQVLSAALELSEEDRCELVGSLIDSLGPEYSVPFDESMLADIYRRPGKFDADLPSGISWAEVKERIQRKSKP